jgi:iron complex outermembrane receptor protein
MLTHRRNLLLCTSAFICVVTSPTWAQTNTKHRAHLAASDQGIETVIVTAEKRAQNSQKVPVTMTVLTGDDLEQQGITGFQDLSARVPSLRFGSGVTGGENVITMRGVGSQNTTPGGDSPVDYSVDGVTLQRTTAVDPEFYDINRIEVEEGPQGTLDGRNSVGGSIHVITNHPTDQFSGAMDAEVGNYSSRIFRGWVNAPLIDQNGYQVNVRITGVNDYHAGYMKNVSTAPTATHNLSGQDLTMLRGQVDIKFPNNADLLLEAITLHNNDPVGTKVQFWQTPYRYTGQPFYTSPWIVNNDFPDKAQDRINLYIARFNWNLSWATLTDVAGYETSYHDSTNDGDGSGLAMAYNGDWLEKQRQMSNEIRLASTDPLSPWQWVGGFYYFWSTNYENFDFVDTGLNFPVGAYSFYSHGTLNSKSWAPFGQVDFNLAKTSVHIPLTLTLGLRFTNDEKYGSGALLYSGFPIVAPFSDHTWSQWTGKFELAYQFSPNIMGYASAARGYLSGGNIIGLSSFYQPEHVWSYEIGEKANLLHNHLQLDMAAYHEDLVNMQVFIQSGPNSVLQNAAGAHVDGLEAQAIAVMFDGLRTNLGVGITNGVYDTYLTDDNRFAYPGPGCGPAPLGCNFAGHKLNQTPPYTVTLGLEYDWQTNIGTITPRMDTFWSGSVYFIPDNLTKQKPYNTTDFSLTWTDLSDRYTLTAFVHNVGNTAVISNDGLQSLSLGGTAGMEPDNYTYYPPRTFGLRFGVKFD